jgi:hypothetical protein
MVGGVTAINIDSAQKVQDSLLPYLAVVVSLAPSTRPARS